MVMVDGDKMSFPSIQCGTTGMSFCSFKLEGGGGTPELRFMVFYGSSYLCLVVSFSSSL